MKKILLLFLAAVFFISCKNVEPKYFSSSPEIDEVKALVKDYNAGDWTAWMTHYADTAKIQHNTLEDSTPAELLEGLKDLLAGTSSYGFTDKDIFYEMVIDDDNEKWVNFWGTWEGTIAANNQKLIIPVHLTAQFVDGKIVEEHGYYDLSEYMAILLEIEAEMIVEEEVMEE
ncbi:nuclear transport factor 2 family protein [uncultured Eudoraea sp.]|uniref:nuclear transport factor 2 family protein n=1 Tax=uncultured Eudoraea sp. TaxID=1035614 RepID=UPI00260664E7|nr:nuclear transport factor 2 family protein [uncultured Eudoraea sp.]